MSILSTVVDYAECDKNSPYKEVNYSPVYSRFADTKDIVHDDTTNHWQERYEEVSCNLYTRNSFDDSNDVSTTYLGYYKSKGEERTFPVDNHIPIDGRGVTEAFLMDNTPMKLFFDSGHQEVICQRSTMMQISPFINYPNSVPPVQV